jgi:hypothetical protein
MSKKSLAKLHEFIISSQPTEDQLTKFVKDLAYANDPTDRTISVRYSTFKKHIREMHPEYSAEFLAGLNPPAELTQKIRDENGQRKLQRKRVEWDDKLIERILDMKDSISPFHRAIYLQFISGRRISEIFAHPIRISKAKPRQVSMVLSKQRADGPKFSKFELIKDTIDGQEFKKMLTKIRTSVAGMGLDAFTSRVNREMKAVFKGRDLSSHDLRGLYAVYRFRTDNPENQNMIGFINGVLNHGPESVGSSMAYSNWIYTGEGESVS